MGSHRGINTAVADAVLDLVSRSPLIEISQATHQLNCAVYCADRMSSRSVCIFRDGTLKNDDPRRIFLFYTGGYSNINPMTMAIF